MKPNDEDEVDLDEEEQKEAAKDKEFAELVAGPVWPSPLTWEDWGLEREQGTRFFAAAAACYRAAPWDHVDWEKYRRRFCLRVPGGAPWKFGLLGGRLPSILLFADGPLNGRGTLQSTVLPLTYGPADDLTSRVRYEIDGDAGWEVAGPAAYPTLEFSDTVPLVVRQREAEDVIALLEALPRFVAANEVSLREEADSDGLRAHPIRWTDPVSGAVIEDLPVRDPASRRIWIAPEYLEPSGPEGPGARPGGRLEKGKEIGLFHAVFLAANFKTYLEEGGGGVSRPPGKAALDQHVKRVITFVDFLAFHGVPAAAVSELDLREFLYWRYPLLQDPDDADEAMLGSLRRFFAFLEEVKGVRCPWAKAILTDVGAFNVRCTFRPDDEMSDGGEWLRELIHDWHARALAPGSSRGSGIKWGVGKVQWALFDDLRRNWLLWRDELVRSGMTDPDEVENALGERERVWAETPNPLARGKTPAYAIPREQEMAARGTRKGDSA